MALRSDFTSSVGRLVIICVATITLLILLIKLFDNHHTDYHIRDSVSWLDKFSSSQPENSPSQTNDEPQRLVESNKSGDGTSTVKNATLGVSS